MIYDYAFNKLAHIVADTVPDAQPRLVVHAENLVICRVCGEERAARAEPEPGGIVTQKCTRTRHERMSTE